MSRPWHIWVAFAVCLALVLAAVGWISLTALRLDRAQAEAGQQAMQEESIRLALWRMDSALGPLIAVESGYPYFAYRSFYSAERAYTHMFNEIQPGEVLLPSPLLTFESPYILLHFQVGPDDTLTSPQVPTGTTRGLAFPAYITQERIEASAGRLARLARFVDSEDLFDVLPHEQPGGVAFAQLPMPGVQKPYQQGESQQQVLEVNQQLQQWRNKAEQNARGRGQIENPFNAGLKNLPLTSDVTEGGIQPLWMGESLLLARRVSVNGRDYVQGCWLDWTGISQWLLTEVQDLLPEARLEPVRSDHDTEDSRMLATLPVRLIPGEVHAMAGGSTSPIRFSLFIAWGCVLLAALAVAVLLTGTISLSERRAAFVSAVTHEMRTPLTTFRMYTEMLVKGMLPDEAKRRHYLNTLRVEANRLSHLVENVLTYARLERSPAPGRREVMTFQQLIDRVKGRLAERAEQAGMELVVDVPEPASEQRVLADAVSVEQILFNLVDNACKYAHADSEKRIHLEADRSDDVGILRVWDHGPGVSRADSRHLFRAFRKSAKDAANSAPGVGLGLALSRRLARSMGGDLCFERKANAGACFALKLRAA